MPVKSNPARGRKVSETDLLACAWYALEQCGLLLTDACILIGHRRYATAVGLAMFAREELGRHVELLTVWGNVSEHRLPSVELIQKRLVGRNAHQSKQRRGGATVTVRASANSEVEKLFRQLSTAATGSEEHSRLRGEIDSYIRSVRSIQPQERHLLRMRSFYVDLLDDGTWQRPATLDPAECSAHVTEAVIDYRVVRDRVVSGIGEGEQETLGLWLGRHLSSKLPLPKIPQVRSRK